MELIFVHSSSFDAKFRYPQHHPPLIRAYIVPSIMALIFFSFDTLFYSMPDFQQNQIDINHDQRRWTPLCDIPTYRFPLAPPFIAALLTLAYPMFR
jgi:hypothetical protein